MLVNRIAHFIKQALSGSLRLRALRPLFLSLCNSQLLYNTVDSAS